MGKYSLSCPKCGTNWQVRFFWKYYVPILGVCILLGFRRSSIAPRDSMSAPSGFDVGFCRDSAGILQPIGTTCACRGSVDGAQAGLVLQGF